MKHAIPHELGTELAVKATKAAIESYSEKFEKYDPKARWLGDDRAEITFKVKMVRLEGQLAITDSEVLMDLDVPLMFRVFKDKAMRLIDGEVRHWIERAREGEFGPVPEKA